MVQDKIKIIKNFISDEKMQLFRDYNDWLLENRYEDFFPGGSGKRPVLQFGRDLYHTYRSHERLESIIQPDMIPFIHDLWYTVTNTARALFNDENEIYPCSFWFAKQFPGAEVTLHNDSDEGANLHFKYSAVLYLTTLETGGELEFTDLNYTIKPEAGDLVLFTSQDTGNHQVVSIPEIRYTLPMWFTEDKSFSLF